MDHVGADLRSVVGAPMGRVQEVEPLRFVADRNVFYLFHDRYGLAGATADRFPRSDQDDPVQAEQDTVELLLRRGVGRGGARQVGEVAARRLHLRLVQRVGDELAEVDLEIGAGRSIGGPPDGGQGAERQGRCSDGKRSVVKHRSISFPVRSSGSRGCRAGGMRAGARLLSCYPCNGRAPPW